jgi:hypothetical protein
MIGIRILLLSTGFILAGSAYAGEMTRGLDIQGGRNGLTELALEWTQAGDEGGTLRLHAHGARDLKGYGLVLQYDPAQYEFVAARESAEGLLDTGSRTPRLFVAARPSPGEVAVAAVKVDGETATGDGSLVDFVFRAGPVPQAGAFQVSDVVLVDVDGNVDAVPHVVVGDAVTQSLRYGLRQNTPNPFNPTTAIAFELPVAERVELAVYNVLGQRVRVLVADRVDAGVHTVRWDGRDGAGRAVASGVYFYRMVAGEFREVRQMLLLR